MNYKKLIFPLFVIVALIQLYVPAKMIFHQEDILATGEAYKFKTAPIDPTDPFRGKYITLRFQERTFSVDSTQSWERNESVYVSLSKDQNGFAKISEISKEEPNSDQDFVKATVAYSNFNNSKMVTVNYPFNRYYMEESKAYDAERISRRRMQVDSNQVVYAIVRVKNGESTLEQIMVNDRKIEDLVKELHENESR